MGIHSCWLQIELQCFSDLDSTTILQVDLESIGYIYILSSCSKEIYPNHIQMDIFCLEENLGYKSIINLIF